MKVILLKIFILLIYSLVNLNASIESSNTSMEGIDIVIDANNQFAFELYAQLTDEEEGNLFFSPYSISTALVITYEGAKGKTADEIQSVFHFPEEDGIRRSGFKAVHNLLNIENEEYELNTANALWAQRNYIFLENYFDLVKDFYGGKVTNLDFVDETEKSRIIINKWVEAQTNDKIKNLIADGQITPMTALVITNAIYFKGTWVYQFDKNETREMSFRINPDTSVQVPMMYMENDEARFGYLTTDNFQMLELPYEGDELSMLIILPKVNLESLQGELSAEKFEEYRDAMVRQNVIVFLPKFSFDTKYLLNEHLAAMGMPTAFTTLADFSGMTGLRDLFISLVIHQAFVEVNEEGTEAAAATAVVMERTSAAPENLFLANHPFIFIILEKQTGNILFLGRVVDPGI